MKGLNAIDTAILSSPFHLVLDVDEMARTLATFLQLWGKTSRDPLPIVLVQVLQEADT